ncbi:MAG: ABC transporter permease, partial [Erysipelotrichaceae bacterium]
MKTFRRLTYPYIIWISIMIVIPMLLIVIYAFTKQGNDVATLQFTLDNFRKFFTDPAFINILWRSLRIAFVTTILCILIGYPVAYAISRSSEKRQTILILMITLPMWINMLVRTYAWIGILADNGVVNNILAFIGMEPQKLLYTDFAVTLGM